ncbi:MAG TPA: 2'-deoxycytidine 5'-triphosphate deaminase [Terracidiphilus sp.]|nr:2'-deoxycytidine 5'-triphosphate deaminase [Terracidiphilus sp.]
MGTLFPERKSIGEGILPSQEIAALVETGKICADGDIGEDQVQPSSLDLRLGTEAYRIRASFLPGKTTTLIQQARHNGMLQETVDISSGAVLQPNAIYVIPLMERLALPQDIYGIANPKSSTGRLDIFTRLIPEFGDEFERVKRGYNGGLYIEVLSQTFPILVRAGMRLNQLRLGRGRRTAVGEDRLRQLGQKDFLVAPDEVTGQAMVDRGLRLTVDLEGDGSGVVGYRAKKTTQAIDLGLLNHYEVDDFWTPLHKTEECILARGEFYILASKQRVRIPADLAAEMLPYDLSTQEFRVHYAGFFDPGFGYGENGEIPGTRAVLEVRANEMPILLEDDQFVGRLNYFYMAAKPDKVYGGSIGSNYQQQGLALSKQFKREQFTSGTNAGSKTGSNLRTSDAEDDGEESGRRFELGALTPALRAGER